MEIASYGREELDRVEDPSDLNSSLKEILKCTCVMRDVLTGNGVRQLSGQIHVYFGMVPDSVSGATTRGVVSFHFKIDSPMRYSRIKSHPRSKDNQSLAA